MIAHLPSSATIHPDIARVQAAITEFLGIDASALERERGGVRIVEAASLANEENAVDGVVPLLSEGALAREEGGDLSAQWESESYAIYRAISRVAIPGASIHVDANGRTWRQLGRDPSGQWIVQGFDHSGLNRRVV